MIPGQVIETCCEVQVNAGRIADHAHRRQHGGRRSRSTGTTTSPRPTLPSSSARSRAATASPSRRDGGVLRAERDARGGAGPSLASEVWGFARR